MTYCTGCGACVSAQLAKMKKKEDGFNVAEPISSDFIYYCKQICFSQGQQYRKQNSKGIWGNILGSFYAWSSDDLIRYQASSGGTLTAICKYLLSKRIVDGIIHIKEDPSSPIDTLSTCSTTIEELISNCGSRYSSSSPLINIYKYLGNNKKYCFIGKPCDVATMRNLMNYDRRFKSTFPILLSFFCAGAPSEKANLLLLRKLKCSLNDCATLKYRGNGWPGYATAIKKNGESHKILYRNAWRDTLGRDIRKICRLCSDGIGEMADIVCFDAWYLNVDKQPNFDEADGRNGVFCRTEIGLKIFNDAVKEGFIVATNYHLYSKELLYSQTYQYDRRSTLLVCMIALKLFFLETPHYSILFLLKLLKNRNIRIQWRRFKGTIIRIRKGKI